MPLFRRGKRDKDAGPEWAPTPPPDVSGSEGPPSGVRRVDNPPPAGGETSGETWVPQEQETWSPPPAEQPTAASEPADKSPWVSDEPAPVSSESQQPPPGEHPAP